MKRMLESFSRALRACWRLPECRFCLMLTVVVFATGYIVDQVGDPAPLHQHLGGEYGNIGRALASGRGFSDPFGERTGPTAWMPPILPLILAGMFATLKSRAAVGFAMTVLDNLALVAMGTLIFRVARQRAVRLSGIWAGVLYVIWIAAFYYYFFLLTHDVCLVALVVAVLAYEVHTYLATRRPHPWRWSALTGLAALTSPAAGFLWACSVVGLFGYARLRPQIWLRAGIIVAVVVAPWCARNALVFHEFIPIKSNLSYDLYMANVVDDDGIWNEASLRLHPYVSPAERFKYAKLGERQYLAMYGTMLSRALADDPMAFVRRIGHRVLASTLLYVASDAELEWPLEITIKRVLQPAVFVGLLLSALVPGRNRGFAWALGGMWLVYILPYILVAYYIRYLLSATPLLVLAVFLGLDDASDWFWNRLGAFRHARIRRRGPVNHEAPVK
jgi:hypothetical protein